MLAFPGSGALVMLLVNNAAFFLSLFIPLSFGLAILRSQLWEIDIINRTLVYGLLTTTLALISSYGYSNPNTKLMRTSKTRSKYEQRCIISTPGGRHIDPRRVAGIRQHRISSCGLRG